MMGFCKVGNPLQRALFHFSFWSTIRAEGRTTVCASALMPLVLGGLSLSPLLDALFPIGSLREWWLGGHRHFPGRPCFLCSPPFGFWDQVMKVALLLPFHCHCCCSPICIALRLGQRNRTGSRDIQLWSPLGIARCSVPFASRRRSDLSGRASFCLQPF